MAIFGCLSLLWVEAVYSQDQTKQVFEQANQLSKEILDLGFDIYLLEESIFFHEEDQLIVFITDNQKRPFQPNQIELKIDGKPIYSKRLQARESRTFASRGSLPITHDYLAPGTHKLEATIHGSGQKRPVSTELRFFKGGSTRFVELQIQGSRKIETKT